MVLCDNISSILFEIPTWRKYIFVIFIVLISENIIKSDIFVNVLFQ